MKKGVSESSLLITMFQVNCCLCGRKIRSGNAGDLQLDIVLMPNFRLFILKLLKILCIESSALNVF